MAVKKTTQTKEQKQEENDSVEEIKIKALNSIIPTLDLPAVEGKSPEEELEEIRAQEQRELREGQKEGQEDVIKKYDTKQDDDGDDDDSKNKQDDDDDDDQLIPKSKVEKRFKALTAKIKELEATNALGHETQVAIDSDTAKLNKMSPEELRQTLKDVRTKSLLLASSDDADEKAQLNDYVDLEMKIHDSINTYNVRFYNEQVRELDKVIASIEYDEDIDDTETAQKEIKKIAEEIYQKYPKMQSLTTGMKQAYQLAVDHYKIMQESGIEKDETKRVKRENTKMKRKVTLDSSKIKGGPRTAKKLDLLRKKLSAGRPTDTDRSEYVKESPMFSVDELIPEQFK